jgi:hypothetical protein
VTIVSKVFIGESTVPWPERRGTKGSIPWSTESLSRLSPLAGDGAEGQVLSQ